MKWARKGYVDELVLQIYRPTSERFMTSINSSQVEKLPSHIPVAIGIYIGNFQNFLPPEEVEKQINIAESLGYGYSIFCWEYKIIANIKQK